MGQACCATDSAEHVIQSDLKAVRPQDKAPGFSEQPTVEQPVPAAVAAVTPPEPPPQAAAQEYEADDDEGAAYGMLPPPPAGEEDEPQKQMDEEEYVPPPPPEEAAEAYAEAHAPEPDIAAETYAEPESDLEPKMVLLFKLPNESFKELIVRNRPLGLDFQRSSPIILKRVNKGSIGEKMGVQAGWEVHSVNGQDVSTHTFEYTYKLLKEASAALPPLPAQD